MVLSQKLIEVVFNEKNFLLDRIKEVSKTKRNKNGVERNISRAEENSITEAQKK